MKEKTFDSAFLERLTQAVDAVTRARVQPAEREPLDRDADEAIYAAFEERGGDSAAAKKQLAAAAERCDQAFGRILQFIADQYGCGPIEQAGEDVLRDLTHDGLDAAESWRDHLATHEGTATRASALRSLLTTHRQVEELKHSLHDDLLWPQVTRIWPEDE